MASYLHTHRIIDLAYQIYTALVNGILHKSTRSTCGICLNKFGNLPLDKVLLLLLSSQFFFVALTSLSLQLRRVGTKSASHGTPILGLPCCAPLFLLSPQNPLRWAFTGQIYTYSGGDGSYFTFLSLQLRHGHAVLSRRGRFLRKAHGFRRRAFRGDQSPRIPPWPPAGTGVIFLLSHFSSATVTPSSPSP